MSMVISNIAVACSFLEFCYFLVGFFIKKYFFNWRSHSLSVFWEKNMGKKLFVSWNTWKIHRYQSTTVAPNVGLQVKIQVWWYFLLHKTLDISGIWINELIGAQRKINTFRLYLCRLLCVSVDIFTKVPAMIRYFFTMLFLNSLSLFRIWRPTWIYFRRHVIYLSIPISDAFYRSFILAANMTECKWDI